MPEVLLGVFDGYMSLDRDKLTSETKIGGAPSYFPALSLSQSETIREWTTCGVCGQQMFLLLQAFSPLPLAPSLHHRMVYVFCCNSSICTRQPSSSWCAFTLQVDAADEQALQDDCSDEVIEMGPLTPAELPPNTFPPCCVDIFPEPKKEIVVPTDLETEMIKAAEENAKNPDITENDVKELERAIDLKDKPSDYDFEKFRRKMAREPTQVLRYYERDGIQKREAASNLAVAPPLFMNPRRVKDFFRIPPCGSCGAALIHEVQIMPTCVYYLRVGEYVVAGRKNGDEGVDWGTVTVFVCSNNCSKDCNGVVLRKEFVLVEKAPELLDEIDETDGRKDLRTLLTGPL
ncbi:putative programmed cell death protein 2 [Trypanosoma grayi]|uniref:putative programmed cell death protein 2 n=1 Tax=Trypanosoma grayi TaxID=71804 RepID=UPI0004F4B598|nr:putative programmed cell death protein 2 [Trypanosoma grayi]KEG15534.1 putative programmed cell death protein 2 [Trypanosoma grayi]